MKPNEVAFVGVNQMQRLITETGITGFVSGLSAEIYRDLVRWALFDKTPRLPAHAPEGVIELMPTSDGEQYSFKYVNGHPGNPAFGLQTVTAFGVLSDLATGYPLLLSEMTLLTALRTACTSAIAAKALTSGQAVSMAIIGNGAQSEFQAIAFKALLGVSELRLYDTDPQASHKCAAHLGRYGFDVTVCDSTANAVLGADIITTITADKQLAQILSDPMITPGVHINAVGGDCPGKTELDPAILRRAQIFVEYPPQTRIEGEIQQLPADHPVVPLWQVLTGEHPGRADSQAITVFDSVGFAIEDFSALRYVHKLLTARPADERLDLIASPKNPKDLFGLLSVAPARVERHEHAVVS